MSRDKTAMNFKTRFFITILVNCVILLLMFSLCFKSNVDLSSRLVDLNLNDHASRTFFLEFLGIMLLGFAANFVVGLGKIERK